uniref:Uncharacterized protein n=1 Tax=Arundo donax TaxID=35708 RepID=A0A0A8Z293_ARUDO
MINRVPPKGPPETYYSQSSFKTLSTVISLLKVTLNDLGNIVAKKLQPTQ